MINKKRTILFVFRLERRKKEMDSRKENVNYKNAYDNSINVLEKFRKNIDDIISLNNSLVDIKKIDEG